VAIDRLRSSRALFRVDPKIKIPRGAHLTPERGAHLGQITAGGESVKAVRKKVLLRILSAREVQRLGLKLDAADAQAMANDFRRAFGLERRADLEAWLARERMSVSEFSEIMWELAAVRCCERWHASEIDRLVPGHISINSALDWTTHRDSN
jgi:hypothetical protein